MDKLVAEIMRKPKMDRKWKPTQKWIGNGDKMKKMDGKWNGNKS